MQLSAAGKKHSKVHFFKNVLFVKMLFNDVSEKYGDHLLLHTRITSFPLINYGAKLKIRKLSPKRHMET